MRTTSPVSGRPSPAGARRHRGLRSGRMHVLSVVTVLAFGILGAYVARTNARAGDVPNGSAKADHVALAKLIDERVNARLKENKIDASGPCTDAEFIRRVYLDITGVIPPADKVRAFLASTEPNKRAKLIDELLEDPRYAKFFAEIWTKAMLPNESVNRRLQEKPLQDWLAERLAKNVGWDRIVYDIVTASGPQDRNGAVTFFVANNGLDKVTDRVTQLFLGVQLQCAQCHNHPFTSYKQDEYWAMAAFFQKLSLSANPQQAAKKGISPVVDEVSLGGGPKKAAKKGKGVFRIPPDGKRVPAKFLSEKEPPKLDPSQPYRPVLAKWMTSKDNRYFARAIVNKMWGHFFGRGLVNPVDDMHDDNPATHPELLSAMAEQMKASGFDLKFLIRAICNSEAYQRSSRPTGNNGDDKEFYSHALVRALSPEQLYDSLEAVVRNESTQARFKAKKKGGPLGGGGPRAQFVAFFSGDDGYKPLEYQSGIPQALRLMNAPQLNATSGAIAQAVKTGQTPADVIEYLYLATLSRRPTSAESERLLQHVQRQGDARAAYADILWALLNSSEFALNH